MCHNGFPIRMSSLNCVKRIRRDTCRVSLSFLPAYQALESQRSALVSYISQSSFCLKQTPFQKLRARHTRPKPLGRKRRWIEATEAEEAGTEEGSEFEGSEKKHEDAGLGLATGMQRTKKRYLYLVYGL